MPTTDGPTGLDLMRALHLVEDVRSEKGNPVWRCVLCQGTYRGSMGRARAHLLGIPGRGVQPCVRRDHIEQTSRELLMEDQRSRDAFRVAEVVAESSRGTDTMNKRGQYLVPSRMGADQLRRDGFLTEYRVDRGNPAWTCSYCGERFRGSMKRARAHLLQLPGRGVQPCKRTRREMDPIHAERLTLAVQADLEDDPEGRASKRKGNDHIPASLGEGTIRNVDEEEAALQQRAAGGTKRHSSGVEFLIQGGYISEHHVEKGNPAWRCCFCGGKYRGSMKRARAHMLGKPGEGIQPCLQQLVKMTQEQEQRLILEDRERSLANAHEAVDRVIVDSNEALLERSSHKGRKRANKMGLEFLKEGNFITGYQVDRGNPTWICCFCGEHFKGSMKRARAHILQQTGSGIQTCKRTLMEPSPHQIMLLERREESNASGHAQLATPS